MLFGYIMVVIGVGFMWATVLIVDCLSDDYTLEEIVSTVLTAWTVLAVASIGFGLFMIGLRVIGSSLM